MGLLCEVTKKRRKINTWGDCFSGSLWLSFETMQNLPYAALEQRLSRPRILPPAASAKLHVAWSSLRPLSNLKLAIRPGFFTTASCHAEESRSI